MSKAVLISIRPEWCKLIASGEKTLEIRKNRPKLKTPFKCFIYCTEDGGGYRPRKSMFWVGKPINPECEGRYLGNGFVVGEFICDVILPITVSYDDPNNPLANNEFPYTGLTDKKIMNYLGNGKQGYVWHISDLTIYDEPKKLSTFQNLSFRKAWEEYAECEARFGEFMEVIPPDPRHYSLRRAPQSWCYVEV